MLLLYEAAFKSIYGGVMCATHVHHSGRLAILVQIALEGAMQRGSAEASKKVGRSSRIDGTNGLFS
jgi:hypothetical protein